MKECAAERGAESLIEPSETSHEAHPLTILLMVKGIVTDVLRLRSKEVVDEHESKQQKDFRRGICPDGRRGGRLLGGSQRFDRKLPDSRPAERS